MHTQKQAAEMELRNRARREKTGP